MKPGVLSLSLAALVIALPRPSFAACTSPAGNAGDVFFSSVSNVMVYCDGTHWISMGTSGSTSFGTLTTNDFCTASSSSAIQCTTGSTGTGNVVLATAPTVSSLAVSSGGVTITAGGLTVSAGGANISGTVTGTTFSGSGASLTNIGTSNLTAVTGTPSNTTYLRGDGTWATVSATTPGGSNTQLQYNNGGSFGGTAGLTWDNTNQALTLATITNPAASSLTLTGGALTGTTSYPVLSATQTWSNAGGTFTAVKVNVTDTSSNAASKLLDLQKGGASQFSVDKSGNTTAGTVTATNFYAGNGSAAFPTVTMNDGETGLFAPQDGALGFAYGGTQGMVLDITGNVGIGSATPATKLDVAGTARFTGNVTMLGTGNAVGTVISGTWNGTAIGPTYGGTGITSYTTGDILYASASNTLSKLAAGTNGYVLTLAAGVPAWAAAPAPTFSGLTDTDFCTASGTTTVVCNTGFTGTGNVVRATAPTITTLTVSSGGETITAGGLTVSAGGANITGTVTGTTFSGSGASLTGIGTSNMTAVTGTPDGTKFLRDDNSWAAVTVGTGSLTGTVTVPNGGTGVTTLAAHGVVLGEGTSPVAVTAAGTAGQVLQSGGASADPTWSTASYPGTTTANQLLYSSATNTLTGLATANNGVLATNGSGVPSITSTLPSAVQGNITTVGTITSGTWNGTAIDAAHGGTGQTSYSTGDILYASGATTLSKLAAGSNTNVLTLAGGVPTWAATPAPSFTGLTNTDFCTASGTTSVVCNTGYTGSGSVMLAASPTTTGTLTAATINASGVVTDTQALAANTSGDGLVLTNTTAATAANQRYSPRLHFTGQGWKTNATAGSQGVDFIQELQPVQGTTNPSGNLIWSSQVDGGGYNPLMTLTSGGNLGIGVATPGAILDVQASAPVMRVVSTSSNQISEVQANNSGGTTTAIKTYGGAYGTSAMQGEGSVYADNDLFVVGGANGNGGSVYLVGGGTAADLTTQIGLTVTSGGNVGIGSTAPSTKLDVNGTVRAATFSGSGSALTTIGTTNLTAVTGTPSSSTYLRGDGTWATVAAASTPGGSATQLQYNNSGSFGGTAGLTWDSANQALTLASIANPAASVLTVTGGSLTGTTSRPALNIAQTWNNAGGTFTAIKANVTDTSSNTASLLMDLQKGGASQFSVDKSGNVDASTVTASDFYAGNGSAAFPSVTMNDGETGLFAPQDGALGFAYGGTQGMVLDTTGFVGIGTASPNYRLDVNGGINIEGSNNLTLRNGNVSLHDDGSNTNLTNKDGVILFYNHVGAAGASLAFKFHVTTSDTGVVEIDNNGKLTASLFSGSGASLTGIGTSNMTGVTGTPNGSKFLRDDNSWAAISVGTASLSGTVIVANGGTGITTLTNHGVVIGQGTSPVAVTTAGTNGQLFIGQTGADPSFQTLSQDCTITSAGVITCTKTNNVSFAASATTDTTNAANITSGTLATGRLTGSYTGITGVGTITAGTWNGTAITVPYGGTGLTAFTSNTIYKGNGTGALATSALSDDGTTVSSTENIDLTSKAVLTEIANDTVTGTTQSYLAKLSGAPSKAILAATSDTSGIVGVVVSASATSGNAQIAISGQTSCVFDNATVAGDYVGISSTTAGKCHDVGGTFPTSGQVLGRVLSTNGSGTTPRAMNLFGSEITPTAASLPTLADGKIWIGVSGTATAVTPSQDCTISNAGVITCLKTNNVSFAASATTDTTVATNITSGTLPSGRLTGSYTGITGIGTITAGAWNGTVIGPTYGGTGVTTYATGDILYASAANTLSKLAAGTNGYVLTLAGGVPSWAAASAPTFSGLTNTDFCTASGTTSIVCNTGYTGTGSVMLGTSPTTTGTLTAAAINASSVFTDTQALAANTSSDGLVLTNTTAATSGNQRYSPRLHFTAQGWKTNATAGSQAVDFIQELQPIQGAANPSGNLVWSSQVNGGGYSQLMALTSAGYIGLGTSVPATMLDVVQNSNGDNAVFVRNPNTGTNSSAEFVAESATFHSAAFGIGAVAFTGGTGEADRAYIYSNPITQGVSIIADTKDIRLYTGSGPTEAARIDTSGRLMVGATSAGGLLTLGASGGSNGTIAINGSTSGAITIQPQAAAGTYNFNLPSSAGSAGQPLLSGGGGATAMSFGTLTGNTTKFTTSTGSLTTNNCAKWDASGNIVDAGTTCGSSGGLTVASTTISSGTNTKVLFDNSGVLGEYTITGTGNVMMSASPTTTGTLTAATINASGIFTDTQALAANTSGDGLVLTNTTAATAANQRYSPRLHFTGQGWKTNATAGSQAVDLIQELQPVQGAANPSGNLVWSGAINGGGYSSLMTLTSGGNLGLGAATSPSKLLTIGASNAVGLQLQTASTGQWNAIYFAESGGAARYAIQKETNNNLVFYSATGSAGSETFNAEVVFDSNGNVGIGTSVMNHIFDVNGSAGIGIAGLTTGTLLISGGTSGTITIQPQAAAGTYNFNLPSSAGSSGQPLLSGGGGTTAMSFGTLTGNTTKFATSTGALTTNNCAKWDASGNIVDAGTTCGGGGGGLTVASTTITSGTNTKVLFDNSGVLGEYTITGTGNVVMSASPTLTGTITAATINASGVVTDTQALAANTSGDGLVLTNTTAATAANQRYSPRLHFTGQGWKTTATAASQPVDFIEELQPVQGTTNPSGNLVWSKQINNGGFGALMTLTSGGNLGVGVASPGAVLDVQAATPLIRSTATSANGLSEFQINNSGGTTTSFGTYGDSYATTAMQSEGVAYADNDMFIVGGANGAGGSVFLVGGGTAADLHSQIGLTVKSGGNVGIGTTNPSTLLHVGSASASGIVARFQNSSGSCTHNPGAGSETVTCSSDIRLKKDVIDAGNALKNLTDVRIREYTVKSTGERRTGVIAQELQINHPDLVHIDATGTYNVDEPNPWILVKAIQELQADNNDLRRDLARLKNEMHAQPSHR